MATLVKTQPITSKIASIAVPTEQSGLLQAVQQLIYNHNQSNGTSPKSSAPKAKVGRFQELVQNRITAKVKIYSKQDPETFVEFTQINGMTFQDSVTGETWSWVRGN